MIAQDSAKMAANFVRDEFFKLSIPAIIARKAEGKGLQATIEQVTKEAVKNAIKNSTKLAEKVALGETVSESEMAEVTVPAAAEAIATATTKSAEDAMVVLSPVKSAFSKEGVRAVLSNVMVQRCIFTLIYGLASTNTLSDAAKKKDSTLDSVLAEVSQALMEIIAMIAMMGSTSIATSENGISAKLQTLQVAAQTGSQSASAAQEFEVAGAVQAQAKATAAVQKDTAVQNLLASILTEIQKTQNQSEKVALSEWVTEVKSLNSLSMHIQDAENAGIKVLMEQSV